MKVIENKTGDCIFNGSKYEGEIFLSILLSKYGKIDGLFSVVIDGETLEIAKL